jgi:DNA polymerase III subunit delta'
MGLRVGWESVIGQKRGSAVLQAAVDQNRVAHAYLFHGPDGVGKRAAALAFTQAVQCTESAAPCGVCAPCGKVARLVHPDVHILVPQPSDARADDVRQRVDRLAEEPYATIDFVRRAQLDEPGSSSGKQVQYSVARINEELRRIMSFRPVEGAYKVAVLCDADLLRKEAANAFLKLLEEPTPRTIFVLVSSRPDRMLPTILSRCQHVRFDRLSIAEISAGLKARRLADGSTADTIARMADGSFGRALDLAASSDLMEARKEVLAFLRGAYQSWSAGDQMAERVERLARHGREYVKFVLELMLGWVRDLVLVRELGGDAPIVNADQAEEIRNFSGGLVRADPAVMASLIEECIGLLDRNVQGRLLLTVLAQGLSTAMRGDHPGQLIAPLADGV